MKNNKLVYKIFAGLGVLALAISVSFASGFSPANAQTSNANSNESFYGMMGNFSNSDNFYKDMSDLMKKYNVNHRMGWDNGVQNFQGTNYRNVNNGVGMMSGNGGMMDFGPNTDNQQ